MQSAQLSTAEITILADAIMLEHADLGLSSHRPPACGGMGSPSFQLELLWNPPGLLPSQNRGQCAMFLEMPESLFLPYVAAVGSAADHSTTANL